MTYLKNRSVEKQNKFQRRKARVNAKIKAQSPDFRLVVNRSNLYISAQVIDLDGKVVLATSDKGVEGKTKVERAEAAGKAFGVALKEKKVNEIVFDRNGYRYHGRVKAFAEGLRQSGIKF